MNAEKFSKKMHIGSSFSDVQTGQYKLLKYYGIR
jgi:hypothetical protein